MSDVGPPLLRIPGHAPAYSVINNVKFFKPKNQIWL